MRLAFCLDGYHDQVGVELRQDERAVHGVVHGPGELDAIQRQVARVLSLDHDARRFVEVDLGSADSMVLVQRHGRFSRSERLASRHVADCLGWSRRWLP